MQRDEILHLFREHRTELEQLGVKSLALFGSVARDEAQEDSDVDILVEFVEPPGFVQFTDLKFFLEDLLGCRVDLAMHEALKPRVRTRVENEARLF